MKQFLTISTLFFVLLTPNQPIFGFLDVVGRLFGSIKKDIVESVITAKITALKPRLLTFEQKGQLVRLGGVFALIMSLISLSANSIVIFHAFIQKRRRKRGEHQKNGISLADKIKVPCLLLVISLALLGVSFSAFWFGEYLIHLPESVRQIIIKQ